MASTTVYLRKTNPGGDVYDTIAAAIAATSSGTGTDDRSKIIPLDSEAYGAVLFGALDWVDVEVVPGSGCAPSFAAAYDVVGMTTSGSNCRILGDTASNSAGDLINSPIRLIASTAASGKQIVALPSGCGAFEMQAVEFSSGSLSNSIALVRGSLSETDTVTIRQARAAGGLFASLVTVGNGGRVTLDRCDWTDMEAHETAIVLASNAPLTVDRCAFRGGTLTFSTNGTNRATEQHSITNMLFIHHYSAQYPAAVHFSQGAFANVNPDVDLWGCTIIGDAAAGGRGVSLGYQNTNLLDVKNLVVYGFETSFYGDNPWSPSYCVSYPAVGGDDFAGGATAGAGMIYDDPVLGEGYIPDEGSPVFDAGDVTGLDHDYYGTVRPSGDGEDIGFYERPAPQIVSVEAPDRSTVVVTFDSPPGTPAGLPGDWAISVEDGLADPVTVTGAVLAGNVVTLTVAPTNGLTPGGLYSAASTSTGESGLFMVGSWGATPDEEGLLEALTGALGDQLAALTGSPRTRLAEPMAADATTVLVESTLGLPASGQVYIGDRLTAYSSRTGSRLLGLTHEQVEDDAGNVYPLHLSSMTIGTPVQDANRAWSARDGARADTMIDGAAGRALLDLGLDLGFGRPLGELDDEAYREFLRVQAHLERGTWQAVNRVLQTMFGWASLSGADGSAEESGGDVWLICPTLEVESRLVDRWILVRGRLCRIREAVLDGTDWRLLLEDTDGPQWQGHDLADGESGIEWELLAFRAMLGAGGESISTAGVVTGIEPAAYLRVDLFLAVEDHPFTFWMGESIESSDGRPHAGIVREDYADPSLDVWPLFLIEYPRKQVESVLADVVPATTFVKVYVHGA